MRLSHPPTSGVLWSVVKRTKNVLELLMFCVVGSDKTYDFLANKIQTHYILSATTGLSAISVFQRMHAKSVCDIACVLAKSASAGVSPRSASGAPRSRTLILVMGVESLYQCSYACFLDSSQLSPLVFQN